MIKFYNFYFVLATGVGGKLKNQVLPELQAIFYVIVAGMGIWLLVKRKITQAVVMAILVAIISIFVFGDGSVFTGIGEWIAGLFK